MQNNSGKTYRGDDDDGDDDEVMKNLLFITNPMALTLLFIECNQHWVCMEGRKRASLGRIVFRFCSVMNGIFGKI